MAIQPPNPVCDSSIAQALGIDHLAVRSITIRFAVGEVATADVTFYPDKDAVDQVAGIVQKYALAKLDDEPAPPTEAQP